MSIPANMILVTGCPRSGTMAVASWLLSVPGVRGSIESRRTVALHAMLREARRFRTFVEPGPGHMGDASLSMGIVRGAARAAAEVLGADGGFGMIVEKEPLERVAFPEGDYAEYLHDVRDVYGAKLLIMMRDPVDVVASMRRRLWGYSLVGVEPKQLSIAECVETWNEAARAAIRLATLEHKHTCLLPYEFLLGEPEAALSMVAKFTELRLSLPPFPARRPAVKMEGLSPQQIYIMTEWERRLTFYDERSPMSPGIVLLTGEPGTGKTTLANQISDWMDGDTHRVVVLDGDELRRKLWPELGYSLEDRQVATRRAGRLAVDVAGRRSLVIIAMVAPSEVARADVREMARAANIPFTIVRVKASEAAKKERRPEGDRMANVTYEEPPKDAHVFDSSADDDVKKALVREISTWLKTGSVL